MIPIPACVVVTAPRDGRVHRLAEAGANVSAGDIVGTLESSGGTVALRAPRAGRIAGSLAGLSQPVAAGDGVLWLARA